MAEQHKPGEIVKTSGIYKVVHEGQSRARRRQQGNFRSDVCGGGTFPPDAHRQGRVL